MPFTALQLARILFCLLLLGPSLLPEGVTALNTRKINAANAVKAMTTLPIALTASHHVQSMVLSPLITWGAGYPSMSMLP